MQAQRSAGRVEDRPAARRSLDSYFMFQRERYLKASRVLYDGIDRALSVLASVLREEVSRTVSSSHVIFIPDVVISESPYVKFLTRHEFSSYTTLPELLREKGEVLKREFGITTGQLMLLARKDIIAVRRIEQDVKKRLSVGSRIFSGDVGSTETEASNSVYHLDGRDIVPILRLIMMEADRRGILKRGRELVIVTSTDLSIFGPSIIDAGTGLRNTKLAVNLPATNSPLEAEALYAILRLPTTASLFLKGVDVHVIVEAVVEALSVYRLPEGLKLLIEYLEERGLLWSGVKRIVKSVGTNPVLVLQATVEWISVLYGYMNRRVDKLEAIIRSLREGGRQSLAAHIEREFERRTYMSINIALKNVVGAWDAPTTPVTVRGVYLSHLKQFISSLRGEHLLEMHETLEKMDGSLETFNALYNLGAFVYSSRSVQLTIIGRALVKMVRRELTRRGMIEQRSRG